MSTVVLSFTTPDGKSQQCVFEANIPEPELRELAQRNVAMWIEAMAKEPTPQVSSSTKFTITGSNVVPIRGDQ